jgi:hypothetical protein
VPLYGIAWPIMKTLEITGALPKLMARRQRVIEDFGAYRPTAHDVVVCAFFKAGTNWTLQIALQIAHRGNAEFDYIHSVVPWPDRPPVLKASVIPLDNDSPRLRSPTGLRVIKTHEPLGDIPFTPEARYIAVTRDPKDVCVSSYHFLRSLALGPLMPSVETWVRVFCSPSFPQATWPAHVASYWAVRHEPNVLFITYEEMKKDLGAAVRRIATFMNVDLSAAELAEVERRASFAYMKGVGFKFEPGQVVPWGSSEYMIRKGTSGGAGELLTPEQQRRIDDYCRAELERLRCDFPYDETFGRAPSSPRRRRADENRKSAE